MGLQPTSMPGTDLEANAPHAFASGSSRQLGDFAGPALGGTVVALGLVVVAGWYTGTSALIQVHPSFVPMQFNTAVGFILAGTGLIAGWSGRPAVSGATGWALILAASLTLLQYLTGADFAIDQLLMTHDVTVKTSHPGRMAPNTAVCFAVSGCALALVPLSTWQDQRARLLGLLGALVTALGLAALIGYAADIEAAYGWRNLTRMAVHTAGGFVLIGAGLCLLSREIDNDSSAPSGQRWRIIVFAAGGTACAFALWHALVQQQATQLRQIVAADMTHLQTEFGDLVDTPILALVRMANRWSAHGSMPRPEWELDATMYVNHQPGLQAVAWMDPSFRTRWTIPHEGQAGLTDFMPPRDSGRPEFLQQARQDPNPTVSRPFSFARGGTGFLVYVPVFVDGQFDGFILGLFRLDTLLSHLFARPLLARYDFQVRDQGHVVLSQAQRPITREPAPSRIDIAIRDVILQVEAWPRPRMAAGLRSRLPEVVLAFGLSLLAMMTVILYQRQLANGRAKEEFERQAALLQNTFDHMEQGITVRDPELRLVAWNERYNELFPQPDDVLRFGASLDEQVTAIRPADGKPNDMAVADIRATYDLPTPGLPIRRVELALSGGRTLEVTRMRLADGRYLSIYTDVTERRRHERELRQRGEELERSNKELEQFAYIASHDLKAPLRGIRQLAAWISDDLGDGLEAGTARHIQQLVGRVARLESLLDGLLAYCQAGRRPADLAEFDSGQMIAEVVDLLDPPADMRVDVSDRLPVIKADRAIFQEVFLNLIGNAIKHHDRQVGHVRVDARAVPGGVIFSVADDGPGIAIEFHERVFEMFRTLKPRDKVEGSGLGLALVRKFLSYQGGTVEMQSPTQGARGTTFEVSWPERQAHEV